MNINLEKLPDNLPIPKDDGACQHLLNMQIPNISLFNFEGKKQNILDSSNQKQVFYFYPKTGKPNTPLPKNWDSIAGARGCTPETLSFKNHLTELRKLGAEPIGISSQKPEDLKEMVERLGISHNIMSDSDLKLTGLLSLPTFEIEGQVFIKRLTLIVEKGIIIKYFYPIFPPDKHIFELLDWLKNH